MIADLDEFKAYRESVTLRSAAVGAGAIVLCALLFPGRWPWVWGLVVGCVFSVLKFRLSCGQLVAFASMPPRAGHAYLVRRRFAMYVLTAAVLGAAFWHERLNGWAAAIGLFLTTLVLCADTIRGHRRWPAPSGSVEGK